MNRKRLAAVVFMAVVLLGAACTKSEPPPVTTTPPVTSPPATTPPSVATPPPVIPVPPVTTPPAGGAGPAVTPPNGAQAPGPNEVWLQGFTFVPQVLTVAVGTTVTWTNKDTDPHDVTSDPPGVLSQQLVGGGTYKYTFTTAGTYHYVCGIHPGMSGTIIVK